jgi:hypothetical protein
MEIILGGLITILVAAFVEWIKQPSLTLEIEEPPCDKQIDPRIAKKARFLRVYVKNRHLRFFGRNAAFRCEGEITFLDLDHRQIGKQMPGRWTGWPEPLQSIGQIDGQEIRLINP